jgi:ribosome-binding protein aMBF1 (putative translation factor)
MLKAKRTIGTGRASGNGPRNGRGVVTVGRKREGQPKAVRNTPAGKFGQRLEELMSKSGFTPNEFAERIGKTPDMVRKYLRGDNTPHIDDWPMIAHVLGLKDASDLLPKLPA